MDTFRTLRREGFKKPSHGNHPSLCYFTVEGLPYDDITILMLTLKYWCRHLNADVDIEILTLKLTLKCWHWNTDVDIEILILTLKYWHWHWNTDGNIEMLTSTLKYWCWHWYRNDIEILTFIFFRGCQPVPFSKSLGTSLLLHGLRFRNSVIAVSYFTIHCILLGDLHLHLISCSKSRCWQILLAKKFKPFQLFTLGLDSQFGTLQGVIQAARDLK